MRYRYEELSPQQFENLVYFLCQKLLGFGVTGFSQGCDGGRDAVFTGTAELYPSTNSPWKGITIIQAKHTNGINKNFSDKEFFSYKNQNCILGKEIKKIKRLYDERNLDNYMLFANRRLGATTAQKIKNYINELCGLSPECIALFGLEELESKLKTFPEIADQADLNPIDSPLNISPDDLAELIEHMYYSNVFDQIKNIIFDLKRINLNEKNKKNNLSYEYSQEQIKRYIKYTDQIHNFLVSPENNTLLQKYNSIVEEFKFKIISKRRDYQTFDEVFEYLIDLLFARDQFLNSHKTLSRAMIFFMYWSCDIGEK